MLLLLMLLLLFLLAMIIMKALKIKLIFSESLKVVIQ